MSAGPPGLASNPTAGVPPVAPTQPVPPAANLPPGATSDPPVPIAEKVAGALITAIPNGATMTQIDPFIVGWSATINIAVEWLKNRKFWPEQLLNVPAATVMSFGIAWGLWHVLGGQTAVDALSRGSYVLMNVHANWVGGKRLGLLAPTPPENRYATTNGVSMPKPALAMVLICGF